MRISFLILFLLVIHVSSFGQSDSLQEVSGKIVNDCCFEIPPVFPGGQSAMEKFLNDNLAYPDSSRENEIEGKVIANFIIDTVGKVTEIGISKGLSLEINKEVIRVLALMPDWVPGCCSDKKKKIKMQLFIPISFTLHNEKK